MNILNNLQYLSIEIGEMCNLANIHETCPANTRTIDKSCGMLTDDDIINVIKDVYENGFRGEVGFHYFNEPLIYIDRIKDIINACPFAKFILWTNGTLIKDNTIENEHLNLFNNIVISNYGDSARYGFYLGLQETFPQISRIINYASQHENMDDRLEIYTNLPTNKYGCCRPFTIEMPIDCYGNVHLCCRDWGNSTKIGNVKKQPLSKIVDSSLFYGIKDSLHRPLLDLDNCPDVCKKCDLPDLVYSKIEYDTEKLPSIKATLSSVVVSRVKDKKRCINLIKSLMNISDEVIVIYDGEDSRLIKELSRHATRVISLPGKGSLEAYSKDILRYCTKDWIFRVDDDETLSPNITRKFLQHLISDRYVTSYFIPRRWYINQNEFIISSPHFPDYQLRLFRNIQTIITLPQTIHAPLLVAGKSKKINEAHLKHWDFCVSTRAERGNKVKYYESMYPQFINKEFYLYENYEYALAPDSYDSNRNIVEVTPDSIVAISMQKNATVGLDYGAEVFVNATNPATRNLIENHENIYVSYHWFNEDMSVLEWDNNREDIGSGSTSCTFSSLISVQTPDVPGTYYLQFDIVEEGVQWFVSNGLLESELHEVNVKKQEQTSLQSKE